MHSITSRLIGKQVSQSIVYVATAALCILVQYLSEVEHVYLASVKKSMLTIFEAYYPAVSTHCTLTQSMGVCIYKKVNWLWYE